MRPNIVSIRRENDHMNSYKGTWRFIVEFDMHINFGGMTVNRKEKIVWATDALDAYNIATKGIERIHGKS